jgi:hypothetical protein
MHLRRTFSDLIIPEIREPSKRGFVVSNPDILRKYGSNRLRDAINHHRLNQAKIYRTQGVENLINDFLSTGRNGNLAWAIFVMQCWLKNEDIII